MDWPLHNGFGKVIITITMKGAAMINVTGLHHVNLIQPSWNFCLEEGEEYMLTGKLRTNFYHGVIADNLGCESMNLCFGLHTVEEARPIYKRWHALKVAPPDKTLEDIFEDFED